MNLKALILDDEPANLDHLEYWLEKYCNEYVEVAGTALTVNDALDKVNKMNPDILFLDVELENGSKSFELLELIPDWEGKIVFITAHESYAIEAIKAKAFDYLLKPVSIKELISTVKEIHESYAGIDKSKKSDNDFIVISHLNEIELVRKHHIMYLTSSGNYTSFHLTDGTKTISSKIIKIYDAILEEKNFVRIHNRHIININHLVKIDKETSLQCLMKDGVSLPVSRRKKDEFLASLT